MSNFPLIANIESCQDEDLEIVATLIDTVCWREVNSPSLINSQFSPVTISIFIDGVLVEITDLIKLYEDEDINIISLPPSSFVDQELHEMFSVYSNIKKFDFSLSVDQTGYLKLNNNLVSQGITPIHPIYIYDESDLEVNIINLGKSFHFFTDNYQFGSLIPLA